MVLVVCNLEKAGKMAMRLRRSAEAAAFERNGRTIRITASFGAAELQEGENPARRLARADESLYQAKHAGRNQVVLSMAAEPEGKVMVKAVDKEGCFDQGVCDCGG